MFKNWLKICAFSLTAALQAQPVPDDFRFKTETLVQGMEQPMEIEVAPDGRVFYNEIGGKLSVYRPVTRDVAVSATLEVFSDQENGFLGFALDPGFTTNQWIYLLYSPKTFVGQRLSRFVIQGDKVDLSTEKTLLEFPEQRRECCHHAGSVEFGPDGTLFVSTGDNTHPGGDSDGFAPIDERPDRYPFDAQKSSANTDDLRGKILRIRPLASGGYSIPQGNLFPSDGSRGRPEIYVMGCRNPWRISVDERTGFLYWGDVGPDANNDGPRGSRGYDELNQAKGPGNFGWPYFVGSNFAYARYDFQTKTAGPKYNPEAPHNTSPNNTGSQWLPPAQPAWIYWPYGDSKEFPILKSGGRTACAGPVFYHKKSYELTGGFPEYYDGCLLFYDWQRPFLNWARMDKDSKLVRIEPFSQSIVLLKEGENDPGKLGENQTAIRRPVDSQFGPDGCLYLLDYGETWGKNKNSQLLKISYQRGNLPPLSRAIGEPAAGVEPLTVKLNSKGSRDYENDPLSFAWKLHPGNKLISTNANPEITLEQPGNYVVELEVSDPKGGKSSAQIPLTVGNSPPQIRFLEPLDGDFFDREKAITYRVFVEDKEDGKSSDYEEIIGPKTYVSADWRQNGSDQASIAPAVAYMKQSDCFNCHSVEQKIVGPAFLEIASRYRNQPAAFALSVDRVAKGSSGVWGEAPMLPHQSLHADQILTMVRWIYELEPGKTGSQLLRGLNGEIPANNNSKDGFVVLEASYTDGGRGTVAPLTSKTSIKLRHRRLEAESSDTKAGLKVMGKQVGSIDHGHYLVFHGLNLESSSEATVRAASAGHGGEIQLRTGSVNGDLIGTFKISPTGGWDVWKEQSVSLKKIAGKTDLYVVFSNPGKGGLMNLDWIEFHGNPPPKTVENQKAP